MRKKKSTLRSLLLILGGVALGAAAFCAVMFIQERTFSPASYAERVSEIQTRTLTVREELRAAEAAEAAYAASLRSDLGEIGEEGEALAAELDALEREETEKKARISHISAEIEMAPGIQEHTVKLRDEYALAIRALEEKILAGESEVRICYWTLDDGPTRITGDFLDALDELGSDVHVTFFTSREVNDGPNEEELLRRETRSGHSVQNHSYSHHYNENVYSSIESFQEQIRLQDEWVYENTGLHPGIFRFPGGSEWANKRGLGKENCVAAVEELGYQWIDWSCNAYDAGPEDTLPSGPGEAQTVFWQVTSMPIAVILSHDWNWRTCQALKIAVPQLREKGYVFLPLFPQSATMGYNTEIIYK